MSNHTGMLNELSLCSTSGEIDRTSSYAICGTDWLTYASYRAQRQYGIAADRLWRLYSEHSFFEKIYLKELAK